ncbi:DUF6527 family protein [Pedobacter sp. MW01-1-1]|uniref:DUF6527 family protein n=1 Tax=Pedobacter sp. MW01-1-1 TaxID=3383027 RepID=UPI003FF0701F
MKMSLQYKFVEFIPEKVEEGILYVSIEYCTAIHKCVCGCGNEVVTPLSPTDWKLTFNGKSVTLHPSIGNWNFECKSHYWIRNNKIEFAGSWTEREIRLGRENDLERKSEYFDVSDIPNEEPIVQEIHKPTLWQKILKLFRL